MPETTTAAQTIPTPSLPLSQESLVDYVRVLGTPVGMAANIASTVVCGAVGMPTGACYNMASLLVCGAAGYYGWTRKDWIGYLLLAGSGAAALFIIGEMFKGPTTPSPVPGQTTPPAIAVGEPIPSNEEAR